MIMQKNSLMQPRGKILATVFDIDDTLFESKKKIFTESAIVSLKKLQEKNLPVIIATGRPPRSATAIYSEGIHPTNIVCSNGHLILDNKGNIIYNIGFSADLCERIYQYCINNDLGLLFKYPEKTYEYIHKDIFDKFYNKIPNGRNAVEFENQRIHLLREPNGGNLGCTEDKRKKFNEYFKGKCVAVRIDDYSSDLLLYGISKKTGVEIVLNRLNILPQNVISFGDNDNDIEINDYVGIGVAMGNSSETLKKHANYITSNIEDNGIKNALVKFKLINI